MHKGYFIHDSQSGRSMLEIMAVMAIICLISIGSFKAYDIVTNKAKAHNTAQMVAALAGEVRTSLMNGKKTVLERSVKGPYGKDLTIKDGGAGSRGKTFSISTDTEEIIYCEELIKSPLIRADWITINGDASNECPGKISFVFRKDILDETDITYTDSTTGKKILCPERAVCDGGTVTCLDEERHFNGHKCVNACAGLACDEDGNPTECPDGKYPFGAECKDCPTGAAKCNDNGEASACVDGYYLDGTSCAECAQGVAKCQDDETATSCQANYYLRNGKCFACPENATCGGGTDDFVCGEGLEQNENRDACVSTEPDYTDVDCTDYQSNSQCGGVGSGWYCNITEAQKTGDESACYSGISGKCQALSDSEKHNDYSDNEGFNWWSAYSFCRAKNAYMHTWATACNETATCINQKTAGASFKTYWLQNCLESGCDPFNSCTSGISAQTHSSIAAGIGIEKTLIVNLPQGAFCQGASCPSATDNCSISEDYYENGCLIYNAITCPGDAPVCQEKSCICPDNSTCSNGEFTCDDGYYKDPLNTFCWSCDGVYSDENSICTGGNFSCKDGFYVITLNYYSGSPKTCSICPTNATCTEGQMTCAEDYYERAVGVCPTSGRIEHSDDCRVCEACTETTSAENCAKCGESWSFNTSNNKCEKITLCSGGAGVADTTVDGVTYSGADAGLASDGVTQCKCPTTSPYWNATNSACQTNIEGAACTTQDDCGGSNSDYYCNITNYTQTGTLDKNNQSCWDPNGFSGACQRVSNISHTDATNVTGLGSVRRSNNAMNWWSANNWCLAQGKNLIDIEDFQIYYSGTSTLVVEGSVWSYGCARGKTCGLWSSSPYNQMWGGNILTETTDENGERYQDKYSAVIKDLRVKFNSNSSYFWTKSSAGNTNQNSCYELYVNLNGGGVYGVDRNFDIYSALCWNGGSVEPETPMVECSGGSGGC